jgi:hypothetical protein
MREIPYMDGRTRHCPHRWSGSDTYIIRRVGNIPQDSIQFYQETLESTVCAAYYDMARIDSYI